MGVNLVRESCTENGRGDESNAETEISKTRGSNPEPISFGVELCRSSSEKRDAEGYMSTHTAECGKHQVVNPIYERHIQTEDETDETAGQKYDWS